MRSDRKSTKPFHLLHFLTFSAFFQLIDTFVVEIVEMKKEMVQTSATAEEELMEG